VLRRANLTRMGARPSITRRQGLRLPGYRHLGGASSWRYLARRGDRQVAADLGLTVEQVRDILARARAAVRDELDQARTDGPR
jgi:hypothetical protein